MHSIFRFLACAGLGATALLARPAALPAAQTTSANVTGQVMSAAGAPVVGAPVELHPGGRRVRTDAAGKFAFTAVAPGTYRLTVTELGFAARTQTIAVPQSGNVVIDVLLEEEAIALESLVVGPGQFGVRYAGQERPFEVGREELETAPQITADPFRVLGSIPAVASSDFSARVSVRGRPQSEVGIMLDGIELYEPFHVKEYDGSISTIPSDALAAMRLQAGGFGARWSGRAGAVLDLETVEAGARPLAMSADLGGGGVSVGGDLGSDAGWFGSARYGFLSTLMSLAGSDEDVSPTYGDGLFKAEWQAARNVDVGFLYFGAFDRNRLNTAEDGDFRSRYSSQLLALRGEAELGGARVESRVSHSWLNAGREARRDGVPGYEIDDARSTGVLALDHRLTIARERVVWQAGLDGR